ncbi:MAG: hypothetical protein OXG10_02270 [Candidatus Dadabacteria bacterium]|nr:hypothetical protein [Candidatus Dadabacteria bacterium]
MATGRMGRKGPHLEELLRAYFWKTGCFALRNVLYHIDGEQVTDIDVWLYERPTAFTRRIVIVDAKKRKSPKAYERIIWANGLRSALGVDGAIVATTDKRPSTRALAKDLRITLLDGHAVSKLSASRSLLNESDLTLEDLNSAIKRVDDQRRSTDFRDTWTAAKASLIGNLGIQSANQNLAAAGYFAEQVVVSSKNSEQVNVGLRLLYLTSALAAINLDYATSELAFLAKKERRKAIIEGVRFGQSEKSSVLATMNTTLELVRQYLDNGTSLAKSLAERFYLDANNIQAELIADYVSSVSATSNLFVTARELAESAQRIHVPGFDGLRKDAKSWIGVILDFHQIERAKLANVSFGVDVQSEGESEIKDAKKENEGEIPKLFDES